MVVAAKRDLAHMLKFSGKSIEVDVCNYIIKNSGTNISANIQCVRMKL